MAKSGFGGSKELLVMVAFMLGFEGSVGPVGDIVLSCEECILFFFMYSRVFS